MGVAEDIAEQYPFFAFLTGDPEIGPLLTKAVDPSQQFSPLKFQSELMKTSWFRNRSAKQREWEILMNTDTAEAHRRRLEYGGQLAEYMTKLGYTLNPNEWEFILSHNIRNGVEVGSPEFNFNLRNYLLSQDPSRIATGNIFGQFDQIASRARGEYFFSLSNKEAYDLAVDSAMGYKDGAAVDQYLRERAISLFPHLRPQLIEGKSMKDIFSPHLQILGEEWEMDPTAITYDNPVMNQVIYHFDQDRSQTRPASLHETKKLARQSDNFWRTSRSRQIDSSLTNYFLNAFGARSVA